MTREERAERYRAMPLVARHGARAGDCLVSTNTLESNTDLIVQTLDDIAPLPDREGLANALEGANLDVLRLETIEHLERLVGWRGARDRERLLAAVAVTFNATPTRDGKRFGMLAEQLLAHIELDARGAQATVAASEQIDADLLVRPAHAPLPGRFRILDPGTSAQMRPIFAALMEREELTYDDISQEALRVGLGGSVTFFLTYKSIMHVTDPSRPTPRRLRAGELSDHWRRAQLIAHLEPVGDDFEMRWSSPGNELPAGLAVWMHPALGRVLFSTPEWTLPASPLLEPLSSHPATSYLLSLLQKAVRRRKSDIAWAAASRLMRTRASFHPGTGKATATGLQHLLLRLPIIAVEDVAVPPRLAEVLWMGIAASGGWSPGEAHLKFLRRFVLELADTALYANHTEAEHYLAPETLDPVWVAPAQPPGSPHQAAALALSMRRVLPGMLGDKRMLWRMEQHLLAGQGLREWKPDPLPPAADGVLAELAPEHALHLKEAVDFHCYPPILNSLLLSSLDFYDAVRVVRERRARGKGKRRRLPPAEEVVSEWIWLSRSSTNARVRTKAMAEHAHLEQYGGLLLERCAEDYLSQRVLPYLSSPPPPLAAPACPDLPTITQPSTADDEPTTTSTPSAVRLLDQLLSFPVGLKIHGQRVIAFVDPLVRTLVVILPGAASVDKTVALELPFETLELPFSDLAGGGDGMALPVEHRANVSDELCRVRDCGCARLAPSSCRSWRAPPGRSTDRTRAPAHRERRPDCRGSGAGLEMAMTRPSSGGH